MKTADEINSKAVQIALKRFTKQGCGEVATFSYNIASVIGRRHITIQATFSEQKDVVWSVLKYWEKHSFAPVVLQDFIGAVRAAREALYHDNNYWFSSQINLGWKGILSDAEDFLMREGINHE